MEYIELFKKLRDCTKMFISERSYTCITSFLIGYDCAKKDTFEGFREWLTYKYKAPNNFVFSGQIEYIFKRDKVKNLLRKEENLEDHLINFLFQLFFEFDQERREKGLNYILDVHKEYMRKLLGS